MKKLMTWLVLLTVALSSLLWLPLFATASPAAFDRGDINQDSLVDIDDILVVRAHMFGTAELLGDKLEAALALVPGSTDVDIDTILAIRAIMFGTAPEPTPSPSPTSIPNPARSLNATIVAAMKAAHEGEVIDSAKPGSTTLKFAPVIPMPEFAAPAYFKNSADAPKKLADVVTHAFAYTDTPTQEYLAVYALCFLDDEADKDAAFDAFEQMIASEKKKYAGYEDVYVEKMYLCDNAVYGNVGTTCYFFMSRCAEEAEAFLLTYLTSPTGD